MLRMRFLVAYMGLVSSGRVKKLKESEKSGPFTNGNTARPPPPPPLPPALPLGVNAGVKKKSTRRRQSRAAALGRGDIDGGRKQGWAGVIRELQLSPLLQKRHAHASIGKAMSPIRSSFVVPDLPEPREPTNQYDQQKEMFPAYMEKTTTF